jgi:hypothetical protein
MIRFVMRGFYVRKADCLECRQKIIAMQPAMLVVHTAAKGHGILRARIGPAIGPHSYAVEVVCLDIR